MIKLLASKMPPEKDFFDKTGSAHFTARMIQLGIIFLIGKSDAGIVGFPHALPRS